MGDVIHYFAVRSREGYAVLDTLCASCAVADPGDGWWEIAGLPHCTSCAYLAEQVAEATGEPVVLGQVLTLAQRARLDEWAAGNVNPH